MNDKLLKTQTVDIDYKKEFLMLQEKLKSLEIENEKLKQIILKIASFL